MTAVWPWGACAGTTPTPLRFAAEHDPEERYIACGRLTVTNPDGDLAGVRFTDRALDVQQLFATGAITAW